MTPPAALGLLAAAAAAAAVWLWRRHRALLAEVAELAAGIRALELGDLALRLPPSGVPALSALAAAVNELARRLEAHGARAGGERAELLGILETMAEGVLVADRAGRVRLANRAGLAMLGAPPDAAARGGAVADLARVPALLELLGGAAAGPRSVELDLAGPPPRTLLARAAPLAGEGGVLVVLEDVTEFKRRDAVRRDFVANASHELKTPLAAIQGYAEALAEETGGEEAGIIVQHARRMGKLVDDLLALSRLEARKTELKARPVDLAGLAQRTLALVRPQAEARGVALAVDVAGAPPALADEEALLQVLLNLLDNAVKYTPGGGAVRIGAAAEPPARVRLFVRDSGPGIAAEHLPRLFERFYRVDKARSRELGGTGLGLAIVKQLAELMGGEAYVTSEPGAGTEAGVRLPAAPPAAPG